MSDIIRPALRAIRQINRVDWKSFGFRRDPSRRELDEALRDGGFGASVGMRAPRFKYSLELVEVSTGRVVARRDASNLVTRAGCADLLTAYFKAGTQTTAWYIGVIKQQSSQSTGAMTSGQTALTVGTSVTTLTGQQVTVFGAGTSGANLVTTISAGAASATQTLSAAAGTTVSGAIVVFGPTFATTDTQGSHANWTEIATTDVTDAARQAWTGGAVGSGSDTVSVDNSASQAIYHPNTNWYACGLFMASNNVIAGTTGTLYGEAGFTQGALSVQGGGAYQLNISSTLQAAAG
jgi:hypothetical protein